jgi:subfamily B ATP-binding cassette protein MsbA
MKKFWRYISEIREVRHLYYIGILFAVIFAAASGFSMPFIIYKVLPWVFEGGDSMEAWKVWVILFAVPGVFTVRGIAGYLNAIYINKGGFKVLESIRNQYFQKLLLVEVSFFNKMGVGELVSRLTADGTVVQQTFTEAANDVVKQPLQLFWAIGFLVYLSIMNPQVSLMLAALFVIPVCVIPVQAFGKRLFRKAKKQQEELGDLSDRLTDVTLGAREIRSFRAEARFTKDFSERLKVFLKTQLKVVTYYHALSPSIEIITTLGVGFAFLVAYYLQIQQNEFMALLTALYLCYEPVKKIGVLANRFQRGQAALERMEVITMLEPAIKEPLTPKALNKIDGNIAFEGVGFSYTDVPTLEDVSFEIKRGEKVAVVGPSGAGKSTLIQLLPRFYDVATGAIRIDGHDIRELSMHTLRSSLSLVSQEPVLFAGTFEDNLRIGNPEATRAQIEDCARKAYIHDFIMSLPDGYKTQSGQRGLNLSGGQKQRIALARAFLKQSPILIMDEATSALDSESEENIQKALANLFNDVTALIIAHRFSSIRFVDRILVLNKGRLIANGTHDELFETCELYRKLYNNQIQ